MHEDFAENIQAFEPDKPVKKKLSINYTSKFWKKIDFSAIEKFILERKNNFNLIKIQNIMLH